MRQLGWSFTLLLAASGNVFAQNINTVVGGGPNNLPALQSSFFPEAVALDAAGNLYILSRTDHRVFKVDTSGTLTAVAGTGGLGSTFSDPPSEGVPAVSINMRAPVGIAVDPAGNVYVADTQAGRIRRVDVSTGLVSTYAGDGGFGFAGDGGQATLARFNFPKGIAFDSSGNLYVADSSNHRIRRVLAASGVVNTMAGSGSTTFSDGSALFAGIPFPSDVGVDGTGRVFFVSFSNRVRRLASGSVTTVAGTGSSGFSGDGGAATSALINTPNYIAVEASGNFLIADRGNHRVRRVASGVINTVAGNGAATFSGDGGLATSASMNTPEGIAVDGAGNFFVVDSFNRRIRRVDAGTSVITTYAGNGTFGFSGEGAPALDASLRAPAGVALDAAGNIYIADDGNNRIRKVDVASGLITTLTGNGLIGNSGDGGPAVNAVISQPLDVAVDTAGNVYFADTGNHRIRRIDAATGIITKVAGTLLGQFSGDGGPAFNASLNRPSGLAFDVAGNLFVADRDNHRIRRIDGTTGVITTVAGGGAGGDGIPATTSRLFQPKGIAVDTAGNLFIADTNNNRVRRVDQGTGIITTSAGTGTAGYSGDGGPGTSALVDHPTDVEVDEWGNVYIADQPNHRIRVVDTAGVIRRFAGTSCCFRGDGGPAISAAFDLPQKLALDGSGNLLVSDTGNDRVRRVELSTDLGITKDDGRATVLAGGAVSYTITVTNNGPLTVDSLSVVDSLTPELQNPVFTASAGTYTPGPGEWTGLTLAPGQSVSLTLDATVNPAASGNLVNTVAVAPSTGLRDPVSGNDTAVDSDTIVPPADLSLSKTSMPEPVASGGLLTFQLDVTNPGPGTATGVVLSDPLPADVTFVSVTPPGPVCGESAGVVTCNLGTLGPSANATVTITVRPTATGSVLNTASVTAPEDLQNANNVASATATVESATDALVAFTVTSTNQRNLLQWVNPGGTSYGSTRIVFRSDRFPTGPGDGTLVVSDGSAGPGGKGEFPHDPVQNDETLFYAAYVELLPSGTSAPRFAKGRAFDSVSGPVRWAYSTGAAALAPPGIGPAIYGVSNDGLLHAVAPGSGGGDWPTVPSEWHPVPLGAPLAQSRPPVVPTDAVTGSAARVVFLGTQNGNVHAIDAETGAFLWPGTNVGPMVQASAAGMFTGFSGAFDYILIGTRSAGTPNRFLALRPSDGSIVNAFDNGGAPSDIGIISGGASVDYPNNRVYFASRAAGSANTLWCLNLTGTGLTFRWAAAIGDIDGSPIRYNGAIYVGTNGGRVHALDASSGVPRWSAPFDTNDGAVKGFLWPEFGTNRLYFTTTGKVWSISDNGTSASLNWSASVPSPSVPLFLADSHYLIVGGDAGRLYQFDVAGTPPPPPPTFVILGESNTVVGSPSLDLRDLMIYVGTDAGVIYAVDFPLP